MAMCTGVIEGRQQKLWPTSLGHTISIPPSGESRNLHPSSHHTVLQWSRNSLLTSCKADQNFISSQRHPPSKLHPAPDCSVLPLLFQVMKALDDLKQLPTQNVEDLDEAKCLASLHTVYSMTLTPAGVISV